MLNDNGIAFTYREYRKDPLTLDELRDVLQKLGVGASAVFRKRDTANRALGLTGSEPDEVLLSHMVTHPTLLQRPIGIFGDRAAVGRPPEALLGLTSG